MLSCYYLTTSHDFDTFKWPKWPASLSVRCLYYNSRRRLSKKISKIISFCILGMVFSVHAIWRAYILNSLHRKHTGITNVVICGFFPCKGYRLQLWCFWPLPSTSSNLCRLLADLFIFLWPYLHLPFKFLHSLTTPGFGSYCQASTWKTSV